MKLFNFVGGEYLDSSVEDSFVKFDYALYAKNRAEAVEKFAIIFPGVVMVSVS